MLPLPSSLKFTGTRVCEVLESKTAVSTWTIMGVFLRKYLSDPARAQKSNYILGFLLSIVAIDLAFHDEILDFLS